jgi:KDO2-lipid IV(A) lauroyltransferase
MKYLEYVFFMLQKALISAMPYRFLYAFSDLNAFILRYVFRYRTDVVKQNLRRSFPEKTEDEINAITRKFYHNLIDIMVESIKGYSLNISILNERYKFLNIDVANKYFDKNRDIILALSHYGNWEWGSQIGSSAFRHSLFAFYNPLANKYIDKYVESNRAKRKIKLIPIDKAKIPAREEGATPRAYLLLSDQNTSSRKAHWMTFLNQNTPCHRGMDLYARQYNMPVIYVDIQRIKRGHYTVELEELVTDPVNSAPGEITERYMRKLESVIRKKPEDWLWSHRRWKRSGEMPASMKRIDVKEPEMSLQR